MLNLVMLLFIAFILIPLLINTLVVLVTKKKNWSGVICVLWCAVAIGIGHVLVLKGRTDLIAWILFPISPLLMTAIFFYNKFSKRSGERAATVIYDYFENPDKIEVVSVEAIKKGMFSVIVGDYGYSVMLNKFHTKVVDVIDQGLIPSIRDQRAYKAVADFLVGFPNLHQLKMKLTYDRDHVYILELNGEILEVLFDEDYKRFIYLSDKIPSEIEDKIIPDIDPALRDKRARQAVERLVLATRIFDISDFTLTYDTGTVYILEIGNKQYEVLFDIEYKQVKQLREIMKHTDKAD
ncbi:hypothetical protein [Listeria booriae]|uniref:hypothetical protein n=1 Tax=Listeria booriae TaxID=1552123 RepID=UPI001E2D632E|nr:hypothetical protein [Listeria booriae]MCD2208602.1 hypothetical protein [Listeria booriae]